MFQIRVNQKSCGGSILEPVNNVKRRIFNRLSPEFPKVVLEDLLKSSQLPEIKERLENRAMDFER